MVQENKLLPMDDKLAAAVGLSIESPICTMNIAGFSLDNFKTFNPEGYTILCRFGEPFNALHYFPNTSKIILETKNESQIFDNLQNFIPNVSKDLSISEEAAIEKSVDFFFDKQIYVEPKGIQGTIYNVIRGMQNYVPMVYTSKAVSVMKTTGLTGIKLVHQAPLTFVGATYIGSMFCSYAGGIAGNNPVGSVFNFTSFLLSRPMRGVEITLNGLLLRPVSNVIGIPLVLNGTQELLAGKGLTAQEYSKIAIAFERISNSTLVNKTKEIYKIIRGK